MIQKDGLLASDMDGTVIPYDQEPERAAEITEFYRLVHQHANVCLAYVTGRHFELGLEGVKEYALPEPHIFVCDVGSTIYLKGNGDWRKDEDYRLRLRNSWHNLTGSDIAELLSELPELEPQESFRQKEFKQSYYAAPVVDRKEITEKISRQLSRAGIKANIIYSVDVVKHVGLIDVLPVIAAKDYALEYLWRRVGVEKNRVVYAGDSGNDLLAFVSGFNAIVVNNTADDVKQAVRRQITQKGCADKVFFASGNYVQGVVEGCRHFGLFP